MPVKAQIQVHTCTPELGDVHAGRPAPSAALTWTTQQRASSKVGQQLHGAAMFAPRPVRALHPVKTQGSHKEASTADPYA